jgi:acyl-CoA-dependent ceramide synthase
MVLHIEQRRKDHWQMFAHHIVTTLLISFSYSYHQTRVSNLILCIMDVVELFFPVPPIHSSMKT